MAEKTTTVLKEALDQTESALLANSKVNQYLDISLTEEEAAEALRSARQEKARILALREKEEKYQKQLNAIKEPFTPETLYDFILWRVENDPTLRLAIDEETKLPKLIVDDDNKQIIRALCYYFTNDERFTKFNDKDGNPLNWSLNKGIALMGFVGVGKSTIMDLFSLNKRQCYKTISCRAIADSFADYRGQGMGAHQILHAYSANIPNSYMDLRHFLQKDRGYCFDDLGTEDTKKNFGNEVNVMQQILLNRYDKKLAPFHSTHITSNLTTDQIGEFYGERVRSRLREMFNVIELKGSDRRK